MDKIILIDGKEVGFGATALTPRLYRHKIGRDIIRDLNQLKCSYEKSVNSKHKETEKEEIPIVDLEIFENVAYVMARQYDDNIPATVEEWLQRFCDL